MNPLIFGILNVTRDSFSDGGRFFLPDAAIQHARQLIEDGADVVDVGAASSHPDAETVSAEEEQRRLRPVLAALRTANIAFSVDSYLSDTQRFALDEGASWLNDIQGFADPAVYAQLATSSAGLIVMHSIQRTGPATRVAAEASTIVGEIGQFFEARVAALEGAGISRDRIMLDPGMGFFLGDTPEPSVEVLQQLPRLTATLQLPLLISVSRKSFLRRLVERNTTDTGRDQTGVGSLGAATVAAEVFSVRQGAAAIRTHDPAALRAALVVFDRLSRK